MSQLNLSIGYEEDKLGLTIRFIDRYGLPLCLINYDIKNGS
jgi:hypothetical protein